MNQPDIRPARRETRRATEPHRKGDPRHHTAQARMRLVEVIEHLESDIRGVDDPRAKALFETSREVLGGLVTAFEHFEEQSEPAWR